MAGILRAVVAVLASYLIGSIPTAYLVGKLIGKIDIREIGSGNVGATNILRTFGVKPGVTVLFIDALKGVIPVLIISTLLWNSSVPFPLTTLKVFCFLGALCGHLWPVFLRFKGGKGVATSAGGLLALHPPAFLVSGAVFFVTVAFTRYISLGSVLAAVTLPVCLLIMHAPAMIIFIGILAAILVIVRHRANISRLLRGDEKKLGEKVSVHER
ncbi:MAG: glycerol-3-phosphate 1-O-acyltransferase PlsY [Candidatus Theseobacter exili]|nr:glycerol-3-phosphate 1-O-acyltransferase PlsY [Candidatus Theseobacter exili]